MANDYLRYDASTMKQLLVDKLTEDGTFTDQLFEDSNLSVIIDVFAYMYDVLSFQLNHAASEAIFTDASLYENLNRIVKMLDYNPKGFTTSIAECALSSRDGGTLDTDAVLTIPLSYLIF